MSFWEIVIEGRQGTSDMLTVLHYESSGVEPPDFDAAATIIRGHLEDHLQTLCGPRVSWEGITAREDILGSVGVFYPFSAGTLTGTNGDDDQVDVVTMLVRKQSQGLVRPTHGWFQQGGITTRTVGANNTWDALARDAVEAYAEDIRVLNIVGPTTLTMLIKASNPTAPNTQPYSVVNTLTTDETPRTQRTRLRGVGS